MRAPTDARRPLPTAQVFSIAAGQPFLASLATAVRAGTFSGAPALSAQDLPLVTIYLPNRAARDALRLEFLKLAPERATLLPRIAVLGADDANAAGPPLPAAPGELERRLMLTRLVLDAAKRLSGHGPDGLEPLYPRFSPAEAFAMAGTLATLIDDAETEGKPVSTLLGLARGAGTDHEQLSRRLLLAVLRRWQACEHEQGWIGPAARRNAALAREAEGLADAPGPIIVAGSTGSIPATAAFMRSVLARPSGFVVLPGLDRHADADDWAAIGKHPEHPQHGLSQLLRSLGIARDDVAELAAAGTDDAPDARFSFLAEALRPASTLHRWAGFVAARRDAPPAPRLGLSVIEADSPHEEAETAAHILREAMETPGRTAALICPDAALHRRVAGVLKRWGIEGEADGTDAGAPLRGPLARCLADGDPVAFVFLLKHIAAACCETLFRRVTRLEAATVRQSWLPPTIAALPDAVARTRAAIGRGDLRHPLFLRTEPDAWREAEAFAMAAADAVAPLNTAKNLAFEDWLERHRRAIAALARLFGEETAPGKLAEAAADLPDLSGQPQIAAMSLALPDYAALVSGIEALRPAEKPALRHPRLSLWTPLDARLMSADVVVLAGLNEGCWPETSRANPWLSLAEYEQLGLPPPERRLGQAAHDFISLASAGAVTLIRAKKSEGKPCRPSRWLVRLKTLAAGLGASDALTPDTPWLDLVRRRVEPQTVTPCARPRPCPPVSVRPRRLSVTAIETWLANPYALYAQHILKLSELRQPGLPLDGRERGILVHRALHDFTQRHPVALPADPRAELMRCFDRAASDLGEHPRLLAFWRPRFERFAAWFAETEPGRRDGIVRVLSEVGAQIAIDAPAGSFTITARADRIDIGEDGRATIYDYKTSEAAIKSAMRRDAPQLSLEGLLARQGAFPTVPGDVPARLGFVLTSGGDAGGRHIPLDRDPGELIAAAERGIREHIARFDDPATPYAPLQRVLFADKARFDAYAHLARVAEWSADVVERAP